MAWRTHAENNNRVRNLEVSPCDDRTRRRCSGHLRKRWKILRCRHVLTFAANGSSPPVGPRPRSDEHASAPTEVQSKVRRLRANLFVHERNSRGRDSGARRDVGTLRLNGRGLATARQSSAFQSCAIASSTPTALRLPQSHLGSHVRKLLL